MPSVIKIIDFILLLIAGILLGLYYYMKSSLSVIEDIYNIIEIIKYLSSLEILLLWCKFFDYLKLNKSLGLTLKIIGKTYFFLNI